MFEDFVKKLKKIGIGADESLEIPEFPTYEEVKPMNTEKYEEIKKPATPIVANTGDADSNIELKVMRPATFADVSAIADNLIDGCTVVLNLELLDRPTTVRMLDFLNGVTYTKDGEIKNVAPNTYIITPNGIDVHE